jgi:glycolate oxidase
VLTEVTVALLPMPASSNTGVAYFPTLADAGRAVDAIIGHGIVPATLEFLDAKCIGAVEQYARLGLRDDAGALLLFGDDGSQDVVDRNLERIGEQCTATGAMEVTLAENIARAQALLEARRCSLPALSRLGTMTILEDATVPRPRLAEMVDRIDASTSTTTRPSSGPTRPSARSSRPRSRWTGRSPASTAWARRSCPT